MLQNILGGCASLAVSLSVAIWIISGLLLFWVNPKMNFFIYEALGIFCIISFG